MNLETLFKECADNPTKPNKLLLTEKQAKEIVSKYGMNFFIRWLCDDIGKSDE